MSGYNGWANYVTWRVNLEMLDGMTCEDFGIIPVIEDERDRDIRKLAERIEAYVVELVEMDAKGFALDLALNCLHEVDWQEIALHMLDDAVRMRKAE
jgi:hypothetical protein